MPRNGIIAGLFLKRSDGLKQTYHGRTILTQAEILENCAKWAIEISLELKIFDSNILKIIKKLLMLLQYLMQFYIPAVYFMRPDRLRKRLAIITLRDIVTQTIFGLRCISWNRFL